MDYRDLPHWKELEIRPFSLTEVPSGLEWCIYPEENDRGEVLCPKSVYMTVLALRWILSHQDSGLYDDYETWKVYWKSEGLYGFTNHIYLAKEKVEGYDYDDEYKELQPQTWLKLATLQCRNGKGIISHVTLAGSQPYGGEWEMDGMSGVRRLLEDAIRGSRATNHHIEHHGDVTSAHRIYDIDGHLGFTLKSGEYCSLVGDVELRTWHSM